MANFVIDTYSREIERYGTSTIQEAEFLFCKNSDFFVKQCLHLDDEEKIIVSLFYMDKILDLLKFSINEKLLWIKNSNDAFKKEFNADKKLNSQLDKRYRLFKPKYVDFLESEDFLEFRENMKSHCLELEPTLENIILKSSSLQDFFQSIFHMNINRMFVSNQRLFEMIIYDYLFRYYKTISFHEFK
ncbi:thiopeptide-type bacteriocin biosynthesis protein [Chryseobacterium limigenitum]|uniref:thiopeptide-type bacteriocin biosynthesis protein n=1 Tax=Chryseobacterium limigenitum TaxID=1612149 RepID=UPI0021CD1D29|nr:thiopeptide-type bacteriocin biosynthesis protein [Chryseobacterium limigenitum]